MEQNHKTLKIRCPCCDEEIILEIDIAKVISKHKNNKISKNLDIEFGMQNGGEKINE